MFNHPLVFTKLGGTMTASQIGGQYTSHEAGSNLSADVCIN